MRQLKAIFGFSSNLPSESRKLSHRNENYCKEEEKPAWVWRRVARRHICCQGKGKSHSLDGLGNSHSQVSEEQFQDQLPYRWTTLGAMNTKTSVSLLIRCFLPRWKHCWRIWDCVISLVRSAPLCKALRFYEETHRQKQVFPLQHGRNALLWCSQVPLQHGKQQTRCRKHSTQVLLLSAVDFVSIEKVVKGWPWWHASNPSRSLWVKSGLVYIMSSRTVKSELKDCVSYKQHTYTHTKHIKKVRVTVTCLLSSIVSFRKLPTASSNYGWSHTRNALWITKQKVDTVGSPFRSTHFTPAGQKPQAQVWTYESLLAQADRFSI